MGVQLDSIADAVSSGVTPAIAGGHVFHAWAPAIPAALVKFLPLTMAMAATWRLARFNVEYAAGADGSGFRGMPAPAGALVVDWHFATAAQYEMFGSWGFVWIGWNGDRGGVDFIGSTLIPWWMISDRPMMDLKGWGKNPNTTGNELCFWVAWSLLESWWQFLAVHSVWDCKPRYFCMHSSENSFNRIPHILKFRP
jgi:phosphatidylserine synthase